MWKFHDFSVRHILREINYGESKSSKTAVFAIFGGPEFLLIHENKNSEPINELKCQILIL